MTDKTISAALAAAQAEMTRAIKDAKNPHFKTSYADLASVHDACMPALTKHGIAVIQPIGRDDFGAYVDTVLMYGEQTLTCRIHLLLNKNDMQGLGSAITYARRYGLMAMTGVAPDDDDGNAAVASGPAEPIKRDAPKISPDDLAVLQEKMGFAEVPVSTILKAAKVDALADIPADSVPAIIRRLDLTIEKITAKANTKLPDGDDVPEFLKG